MTKDRQRKDQWKEAAALARKRRRKDDFWARPSVRRNSMTPEKTRSTRDGTDSLSRAIGDFSGGLLQVDDSEAQNGA